MLYVQTGDVVYTKGRGSLAKLIRWAERTPGEEPSWANHVGIVTRTGWLVPPTAPRNLETRDLAYVAESLWYTIDREWWPEHRDEPGYQVRVYRPVASPEKRAEAVEYMRNTFVGSKYGWWKIATHLIDNRIFKGRVITRRLLSKDNRPICSYSVAKSLDHAKITCLPYDIPVQAACPDEMEDFAEAHGTLWKYVGEDEVPTDNMLIGFEPARSTT